MSRPLLRAASLLLAAACTRAPSPAPAPVEPAAAPPAARASAAPAAATRPATPPLETVIRPRPEPCLPGQPFAPSRALAAQAAASVASGEAEHGLACAEEALRVSPRLVPALAARGSALAGLGRLDEARLAFARALAVDPDDPAVLLGAADLFVRLGDSRDALELGLEYALRGLRAPGKDDGEVVGRLALVAGMAENDLGRSERALARLERAATARPDDPDVAYERGVALYELCRFDEAQRAFERALALAPDDPWTLHQLGLLAERRDDADRARGLLAKARTLASGEIRPELQVDAEAFRAEVESAVAALTPEERALLRAAPVEIHDLPALEDLLAVDPPLSPSILGLFRGPSIHEDCTAADGPRCRSIVFYRKNLLRFARDRGELTEQVRVTLLHELGHLNGETDDELRDRGLE